jgi:hypothetical protein
MAKRTKGSPAYSYAVCVQSSMKSRFKELEAHVNVC